MKLYKLKKGQRFRCEFINPNTEEIELTVIGKFLGMDGTYGKVLLDGIEYNKEKPFTLYHNSLEVEVLSE